MSQTLSNNTKVRNTKVQGRTNTDETLAEDYLAEKGYEKQTKPRAVNGGRDRVSEDHTRINRARLNDSLSTTPASAPAGTRSARRRVVTGVKVTEVRREKPATPFPFATILCIIAFALMSFYVIHLYIEIEEIDTAINTYNNQIAEMKNEERVLLTQKAAKYDLEEIERIAKEKYGMVDEDQLPKEYITPDTEDSIEIMETSLENETPDALLSGFAIALSDIFSYIN